MTEDHMRVSRIRDELTRLAGIHGGELKPQVVVDAARAEESPLHKSFEWDNSVAAEQWRLAQARQIINAVVTYEKVGKELVPCRVFVSLTPDRKGEAGGYRLATTVMTDASLRQQMLSDALAEMQSFRDKYRKLNELAKVFEAMEQVKEKELQTA